LTSDTCSDPCQIDATNFEEFSSKQKKLSNFFSAKRPADDEHASLCSQASTIVSQVSTFDSSENDCITQTVGAPKTDSPAIPVELPTQVSNFDILTQEKAINSVATEKTSHFSTKRKKLSVSKSKSPVGSNQASLSSFFTRSPAKKTSTPSSVSDSSNNTSPAADIDTPPIDKRQDDEYVDIEQLMKQHEQTVKAGTQWNALFTPRKVPTCNVHKEPCKEFVVNKKGVNHGRRFYLCSR
jgi:AP endonuclease 2